MSLIPQIPSPQITTSVNFDTNMTNLLQINSLESTEILNSPVILTEGFLSNLTDPVANTDVATKNYVDTFSGGGAPGGSNQDIQINNGIGGFTGSNELRWDGSSLIVTAVGSIITDGVSTISGGFLSNLTDPVANDDGATKNYVDNQGTSALSEVDINIRENDVVFTPAQIVNKVINRTVTGVNAILFPIDEFPLPASVLTYIRANIDATADVGYTFNTILRYPQSQINLLPYARTFDVTTPGSGYTAGSKLTLPDYGVTTLRVIVTVGGSGEILTAVLDPTYGGGTSYLTGDVLTVLGGTGGTVTLTNNTTIPPLFIAGAGSGVTPPLTLFSPLGNFLGQNIAGPILSPVYKNVIPFKFTFTDVTPGSEVLIGYAMNNMTLTPTDSSSVTDKGLLAKSFYVDDIIIYPVDPTDFTADSTVTYTYPDLEKKLIIRGGSLTGDVSDTFVPVATMISDDAFSMGSGTFKFFIQNIDPMYDVTLTNSADPANWTMDPASDMTIGAGKTGAFWVSVDTTGVTARVFSIGIFVRDGA